MTITVPPLYRKYNLVVLPSEVTNSKEYTAASACGRRHNSSGFKGGSTNIDFQIQLILFRETGTPRAILSMRW